jgi:hypothetical protein
MTPGQSFLGEKFVLVGGGCFEGKFSFSCGPNQGLGFGLSSIPLSPIEDKGAMTKGPQNQYP